jgi:hypothetical protein
MELQNQSETRDAEWVAIYDASVEDDAADVFDQRCVSENADDLSGLRALEARVGDVLNTPFFSMISQIALELEVLV